MENKKNSGLYFLIAVIALLFLGMLVLCGLYLDLRINGISSSLPTIPEKDKWILTDAGYDSNSSTGRLLTPSFVGFKTKEDGMIAASFDETARNSLISELDRCLPVLFSDRSVAEKKIFENEEEKLDFVKSITNAEDYFYASFYGDIPSAAILPGTQSSGEYLGMNTDFYVRYLFVLPDESGNMYGVCFDGKLDAVILEPKENYTYNQNDLFAYNGVSGFVDFEFVSETCPEPIYTHSFEADSVVIVPAVSFYTMEPDKANTKQLLNVFGFNTNLVKNYVSGDNMTVSFVDNGRELYVSKENSYVRYNGYDGGIHMSEFLKYNPQGERYTFSDTVLCIKYLISSIDKVMVGGEAKPALVRVTKNQDVTAFEMKYFYNGIMITDNAADITVYTDGIYIRTVEINAMFCDGGALKVPVIPQKLAVAAFKEDDNNTDVRYNAIYSHKEGASVPELIWTVRKDVNTDVS